MDFPKALQRVDNNFESILEIMRLRRTPEDVDSVYNLLMTINTIIDYFIEREDEELKIAVSYFPICEEYAQELCEDFVVLKMGFYTNHDWKEFIIDTLQRLYFFIPQDVKTPKQRELAQEHYRYEKRLGEILNRSKDEYTNNGKTLIYSENVTRRYKEYREANKAYNRKTLNKYWYLSKAITAFSKFENELCPLALAPEDSDELYNYIVELEDQVRLENIVVFPSRTADGRYSDFCSDAFQKPYFDDFVSSNTGLRNVLFFCFSRKPYRLRRLFDFKQRMKERVQITEDESFDFISFTYEESLKLNGKSNKQHVKLELGKETNELQQDYETIFDDITNGLDRYVSRRNEMSLCVTAPAIRLYCSKLLDETESDENLLAEIFKINLNLWESGVEIAIHHFVYKKNVFVITGNDISSDLKDMFRRYLIFAHEANTVAFGTFGDLRGYLIDGSYQNEIKFKRILVMSFRNDYTESIFHKYPNSFDPYCINPDQKLMEINNYFFMRQYFDWGRYNYGKAIRKILKSDFRSSEMKPILKEYKRPLKKLPEDTREEEMDRNSSRVPQLQVEYSNNEIKSYGRSDWMLYKHGNNIGIAPLSDLLDLYETADNLSIQPLTPLVKAVCKEFIDSEREKDTRSEKMFKEQPSYGLTRQEIDSNLQLWKILLLKRIKDLSERKVYDEIMSHFNERYKISFQSFKKWTDIDYGIPRARKMQKYLVEDYLGIRPPYINLIRRIKERTKNDTEAITISVRHFLNIALLNNARDAYEALSPENRDLLDINSPDDVKKIIRSLKDKICYELVKTIKQ